MSYKITFESGMAYFIAYEDSEVGRLVLLYEPELKGPKKTWLHPPRRVDRKNELFLEEDESLKSHKETVFQRVKEFLENEGWEVKRYE
jgi:hypothetical protein